MVAIPRICEVSGSRIMKCFSETGIASFGLPVPEVRLTFPVALLVHCLDDHVRGEGPLIRRVVLLDPGVFDGVLGGEAHHATAGRVHVAGLAVCVGDSDEIGRALDKGGEHAPLVGELIQSPVQLGHLTQVDFELLFRALRLDRSRQALVEKGKRNAGRAEDSDREEMPGLDGQRASGRQEEPPDQEGRECGRNQPEASAPDRGADEDGRVKEEPACGLISSQSRSSRTNATRGASSAMSDRGQDIVFRAAIWISLLVIAGSR